MSDQHTHLVERDPSVLEVRIPLSGDELRVRLTDDLDILETTVERA